MCQQYRERKPDLIPLQFLIKHISPDDHMRGKEEGLDQIKKRNIHRTYNGEKDNHCHCRNNRSN